MKYPRHSTRFFLKNRLLKNDKEMHDSSETWLTTTMKDAKMLFRYRLVLLMTPFFSLIIPCCDVEPYVEECLQSILGQTFQEWECLITIETCKDKTEEIIRKMTEGDARFRIFTGPRTGSCSESRNIGIDNASGEYAIFLDGDDTIADGCLARLHEKISAKPGADQYPCAIVAKNEMN